jgi:hypothetical protein
MTQRKKTRKPQSKAVLSLLDQLKRQHGIRDLPERFLIVCEDDKSAVNYFRAFIKHFGIAATSVRIAGSGGRTQPTQVVTKAIQLRTAAAEADSGTEPFDQVWCVIDGDYGKKIVNARTSAQANGVKLAISNKCFEYWILLHFEQNDKATMNCDETERSLRSKHLPDYAKGSFDFRRIVMNVDVACERAEMLRRSGIKRGALPEDQNPCSEVYKLIMKCSRDGNESRLSANLVAKCTPSVK